MGAEVHVLDFLEDGADETELKRAWLERRSDVGDMGRRTMGAAISRGPTKQTDHPPALSAHLLSAPVARRPPSLPFGTFSRRAGTIRREGARRAGARGGGLAGGTTRKRFPASGRASHVKPPASRADQLGNNTSSRPGSGAATRADRRPLAAFPPRAGGGGFFFGKKRQIRALCGLPGSGVRVSDVRGRGDDEEALQRARFGPWAYLAALATLAVAGAGGTIVSLGTLRRGP